MKFVFIGLIILVLLSWYLLSLEQRSLYYPSHTLAATPADLGLWFEDIYFLATDHTRLHGWFIPAPHAQATVLYCHGNAGNISHRLHRLQFFQALQLNLFLFDYRGYGLSAGRPSEQGLYHDVQAAYQFLISQKKIKPAEIIVYGKSLGGAVATDLCLHYPTRCLVLESTFASTAAMAREYYPFLPAKWFLRQKYDTVSKISHIHIPKLIVHGRQDEIIPWPQSQELYAAAAEPKQYIVFAGEGHNEEVYVTSAAYQDVLRKWLNLQP